MTECDSCDMIRRQGPSSQGWKTFLRNKAAGIASIDLFVVRTISFKLLYGLVILRHVRRRLVSISVTHNPTAAWIAGQVTDAFPWDEAPRHLIRDRDGALGPAYTHRIRAMGIRDHPTAPRSPWQNGHVERLIGSIRRESLDHLIVFGEAHLHYTGPVRAMTVREVSNYLRVHPSTIYRMLKHHQIPAFHVGSDWRFNVETVDSWRLGQKLGG